MTHLYLIRHGQVDGLQPGIIGSATPDSGLSRIGIIQAKRLRDRLATTAEIQADVLISSPLKRARETADIIAPALDLPVVVDDEVQELNLGECEGLTFEEIVERYGHTDWDKEPFRRLAPNADSLMEFVMRACRGIDRITRQYDEKTIVIVCHGGIIQATFAYFFRLGIWRQFPIIAHNTSITHWHKSTFYVSGRAETLWGLVQLNDHTHLRDIGAAKRIDWQNLPPMPVAWKEKE
jgi:probable phosphoglycerate mutase